MDFTDIFPPEMEGSFNEAPLRALHALYAEVDAANTAFREAVREKLLAAPGGAGEAEAFGCPEGCGSCCERFLPDILPVEADYAALYILRYRPDRLHFETSDHPPCPFYDADRPEAHCTIYHGRPLICRLFGYSAYGAKDGRKAYSLCWSMPSPSGLLRRSWEGEELLSTLGALPPLMADYGLRLHALSPRSSAHNPFLGEAIRDSLSRIGFFLSLARGAPEGDLSAAH